MQAIMETLFDTLYLTSVITIVYANLKTGQLAHRKLGQYRYKN